MATKPTDEMTPRTSAAANADCQRTEGDINTSPHRTRFQAEHLDDSTRRFLEEDARWFIHQAMSTPCLNALRSASGAWIEDLEGRRYLDFHGNNVHQVGFGHPRVIAAVQEQLAKLPFCTRRYTNEPAIQLAKALAAHGPEDLHRVLFAPGGASAIGIALKLARVATGRFKTVSLWDSFHGASLEAISIGGEYSFRQGAGPLLPGCEHAPPPDPSRCPFRCGGGLFPLAAILAREPLNNAAEHSLGHFTHEKNPVACAAGLATLQVIQEEKLVARAADLGARTLADLRRRLAGQPRVREVRGLGLLLGVEVGSPGGDASDQAEQVLYAALRHGLSFKISKANVLTFAPPLNIPESELDQAWSILEAAIQEVA